MSEVLEFSFPSKSKKRTQKKMTFDSDDEGESEVVVENDDKSVASEDSSTSHSYESYQDYADSYKELQREVDMVKNSKSEDTVDGIKAKVKVSTPLVSVEAEIDKESKEKENKPKKGRNSDSPSLPPPERDDPNYKISQLEARIAAMEIHNKSMTTEKAYNMLMVSIDNLSTAQKKALINAIISTMK
uniref:NSP5 n=1 Tax=Rotavirus L TaxID=2682576 RepID=A0A650D780_9REOV|nr:NSP5 [Rotavirus L]